MPAWQTCCALLVFQHAPNRLGHTRRVREIRKVWLERAQPSEYSTIVPSKWPACVSATMGSKIFFHSSFWGWTPFTRNWEAPPPERPQPAVQAAERMRALAESLPAPPVVTHRRRSFVVKRSPPSRCVRARYGGTRRPCLVPVAVVVCAAAATGFSPVR